MQGLTKRQREIVNYIEDFIQKHQYSPSYREIMRHFSFTSPGSVYKHLNVLKRKGAVTLEAQCSRSVTPTAKPVHEEIGKSELEIPFIGHLSCEEPIEMFPKIQTLPLPRFLVPNPDSTYALRARGDAMTSQRIADGDLIIVEARREASPGDVVLIKRRNGRSTIRHYYPEGHHIRLEDGLNDSHPQVVKPENIEVQGIVVGVIRLY